MKSKLSPLIKDDLVKQYNRCRSLTLALLERVDDSFFTIQADPSFSPIGWHIGHIGYTEDLWLLKSNQLDKYHKIFAADRLPKKERVNLPPKSEILDYLAQVRLGIFKILEESDQIEERLWRWLIQHESQHGETISFLLQLHQFQTLSFTIKSITPPPITNLNEMLEVPSGWFKKGCDSIEAIDNEQPVYWEYVNKFYIDRYPVTVSQYRLFMEQGGYHNPTYWSEQGWSWLQLKQIQQPLYWIDSTDFDNYPVSGISWYEANAYAKFIGKRLPTEAEWEKAASWDILTQSQLTYPWGNDFPHSNYCNLADESSWNHVSPVGLYSQKSPYGCQDLLGNVWEWTNSKFTGYRGFKFFPYRGYSNSYFDNQHYVLKGGSWATRPWGIRSAVRNWYLPDIRIILAGFRCVE